MTREEARAYIIRHCNPDYPKGKTEWETAINMAIEALSQTEIVRCGECKHNYGLGHLLEFNPNDIVCEYFGTDGMTAEDFCSYGKMMEVGHE